MTQRAIVLVTASFTVPELYDEITNAVAAAKIPIKALHLPSTGTGPGLGREGVQPPSMLEDAAFVSAELEKLADAGTEIVLVAHSYGGIPASQCTKRLTRAERQAEGKAGGVVRIAYIAALVPDFGVSSMDMLAGMPEETRTKMEVDEKGWLFQTDLPQSASLSFSDLPAEEGLAWAKRMTRHSAASFATPLSHAGYVDAPVSYLLCENDLVIPADLQRREIEMIERKSGNKVDVKAIASGHAPIASMPQVVIDWLVSLAS
ncbi:unnamed protein product [Discula destructiva]